MENQQVEQPQQINSQQSTQGVDVEKFIKRVRTAGITSIVLGILMLLAIVISFILTLKINLFLLVFDIILAVGFIILGTKIKKDLMNSKNSWFTVVIGLTIIKILTAMILGEILGFINLVFLVIFFTGYNAYKKRVK